MADVAYWSATRMAAAIAGGERSAEDLLSTTADRIARLDPALGAFVDLRLDAARDEARSQDARAARGQSRGPLGGVPVSVKSAIEVTGLRCETGSPARRDSRASADAYVVRRLRDAGAIVVGTTNVAELLMGYETDNPLHGRTHNPWDLARTPGGSSGGESAAIAAGLSAGGIGSDGGGSIRVPAHFTGICGLKPTPGRIPSTGHQPPCLGPFALIGVVGPMARTVADLSLLYAVLAGDDGVDPAATPLAADLSRGDGAAPRVRWFDSHPEAPATSDTRAAVADAVRGLERHGYAVAHGVPSAVAAARPLWDVVFGDIGEALLAEIAGDRTRALPIVEALHRERGPRPPLTASLVVHTWIDRDLARAAWIAELGAARAVVCPVASTPAFAHGERAWSVDGATVGYLDAMLYTQWVNVLGLPAVVVPVGRSASGLPIGVQVVGRPFDETGVLAVAAAIEAACGGFVPPPLTWAAA
jgi:Asp-tRNA(Asn)/Glu-tRNA(Gln) amidotransferase A subunit family amidase